MPSSTQNIIPYPEKVRLEYLCQMLRAQDIDLLICRLPENILYLTNFWPNTGLCWSLLRTCDGSCTLVLPGDELEGAEKAWVDQKFTYATGDLLTLAPLSERVVPALKQAFQWFGTSLKHIGWEASYDIVADSYWQGEVRPPVNTPPIVKSVMPGAALVDASNVLRSCREVKSPGEIAKLSITNEIAVHGFTEGKKIIRPGIREIDVQIAIESAIHSFGIGYKGCNRVRSFAQVMSGPRSFYSDRAFNVTGNRILADGDIVVVELGICAEGYWADLTRTFIAGKPSSKQIEVYNIIKDAYNKSVQMLKPGVERSTIHMAVLDVFKQANYDTYLTYEIGHGVGLSYHEGPHLHPAAKGLLREGEVYAIEPGLYISAFGGMRIEDNYVITRNGCLNLSHSHIGIN